MMKNNEHPAAVLLAIETSSTTCAVGISCGDKLLAEISVNIKNIHSEKLAVFVEYIANIANMPPNHFDAIILSAGPGSFTGLRIGYSFAKGLAYTNNIPIIEVPTLDVWACQTGNQALPVMPVINAHRGEIFCALYDWNQGTLEKRKDYALIVPAQLEEFTSGETLLTGADALTLYPLLTEYLPKASLVAQPVANYPQLWALLALGFKNYQQNLVASLSECEPFYLRPFQGIL